MKECECGIDDAVKFFLFLLAIFFLAMASAFIFEWLWTNITDSVPFAITAGVILSVGLWVIRRLTLLFLLFVLNPLCLISWFACEWPYLGEGLSMLIWWVSVLSFYALLMKVSLRLLENYKRAF